MKQVTVLSAGFSLIKSLSFFVLSLCVLLSSCSKKDSDIGSPAGAFAGQFVVEDDEDSYIVTVESKGGNKFQIRNFADFLNVPLEAVANGNSLTIPAQTFTNPNGKSLTIQGSGVLKTTSAQDDTLEIQYSLSGYTSFSSDFTGIRK